jgi:hypothetical protein
MTLSITEKGKGVNADAVKVTPFPLAWCVFCVCSFLSFARAAAADRQLRAYRLALVTRRPRIKNGSRSKPLVVCAAPFQLFFAMLVWTDYVVVLLRILVLRM